MSTLLSRPLRLLLGSLFLTLFYPLAQNPLTPNNITTDTLEARYLLNEVKELENKEATEQAFSKQEKALQIYLNHKLWEEAVDCAIQLSITADNFSSSDLKDKYADLVVRLAEEHLPKGHALSASAYRQKAEAMILLGKIDSAIYFLNSAIPLFKQQEDLTNLGWSELLISVSYYHKSKLDSFEFHLQKLAQVLDHPELPDQVKAQLQAGHLNLSGVLYDIQGDYNKAIKNTQLALSIALENKALTTADSFQIFSLYNNLGTYFLTKGDHQRALDHFTEALHFDKNSSSNYVLLNNIGELYLRQKKYDSAISYFKQNHLLTQGLDNQSIVQTNALNGLARTYAELNWADSTLYYGQQAIRIPSDFRKYATHLILAELYIQKKQSAQAIKQLDIASEAYLKDTTASKSDPFFEAGLFVKFAEAYLLDQQPEVAIHHYQKALMASHAAVRDSTFLDPNISMSGLYQPEVFLKALKGKGKALAASSKQREPLDEALTYFQMAVNWIDTLQASYNSEASQLNWSSTYKPIFEEAIQVAYRLFQLTQDNKYLELAFSFSEKSKNAILLEALKSSEGKLQTGIPYDLIQQEKDLNLDIAFYEKVLRTAQEERDSDKEKRYQFYLSKTRLELVDFKEELERDYPKFHNWKYGGQTITIAEVQSQLIDKHSVLLEYFLGESSAFVFVITDQSVTLLPLDSSELIKQSVLQFREVLLDLSAFRRNAKAAFSDYQKRAALVYQHILAAPLSTLSEQIQRLIIVPDGMLNIIPMEALCTSTDVPADFDFSLLPYLLYDYTIHYAYSAELLSKNKAQRKRLAANTSCLAFAPPYKGVHASNTRGHSDLSSIDVVAQLPGTANEIKQISKFVTGVFDDSKTATEGRFKSLANQHGILHLAMHAMADLDNSNFNRLIFCNLEADSLEDNLLHHYEIANMALQSQLVVLSACETGVGVYEEGEGVFSLTRSFMYAGVPSVVMSLWAVNDASTSQLMPYFYERLMGGSSKDGSLQDAKLNYLKVADIEYRHPFYWSPFVVMGSAEELKMEGLGIWWYLGLGLLLIALLKWWQIR
jgi:CHAT domain-containing protein/lipopolysaccharide biosynthesis regulator YciM